MLHVEVIGERTGTGTIVGPGVRVRRHLNLAHGSFVVTMFGRLAPRAERVSFDIEADQTVELRSVDPKRNRARHYHLSTCRSLFGEHALLITWGRIGQPPRARLETFDSLSDLMQRRTELLSRRRAHGYIEYRAPARSQHSPSRHDLDPERWD
jgi:predicted DNA-binding WGR domain protein